MKEFRYIDNIATLTLEKPVCIGCGMCAMVCPHQLIRIDKKKAYIIDFNACMECGACAKNCPTNAISVTPGVGCASYIIANWIYRLTKKDVSSVCC